MKRVLFVGFAAALTACQRIPEDQPRREPVPAAAAAEEYWNAPSSAFEAVEPTVFGISGSLRVWDALAPLGRQGPEPGEGNQTLDAHLRVEGEGVVADVLRTDLADDAVSAEHVRIEFRREVDGWYPTNAYLRHKCRRAATPGEWTTAPCP